MCQRLKVFWLFYIFVRERLEFQCTKGHDVVRLQRPRILTSLAQRLKIKAFRVAIEPNLRRLGPLLFK